MGNLINNDSGTPGIYRAKVAHISDGNKDVVYIPAISSLKIGNFDDLKKHKDVLPTPVFGSKFIQRWAQLKEGMKSCWVVFENGDMKYPIVIGFFPADGFDSDKDADGKVLEGAGSSYNPDGSIIISPTTSNPPDSSTIPNPPEDCKDWCYPLETKEGLKSNDSGREFGSSRDNGARAHAGVDLHYDGGNGKNIIAVADGTVQYWQGSFYSSSYPNCGELVITHGSYTVRYGEVYSILKANDTVTKGQIIGTINTTNMLHLELYANKDKNGNTVSGSLTDRSNLSNYEFVTAKAYKRRKDLLDPTFVRNLSLYTSQT